MQGLLFQPDRTTPIPAGRRPLSVLNGDDGEAITILLNVHCDTRAPRILDCTHNRGFMWRGLSPDLVTMDLDPAFRADVVADFRSMPFPDRAFDVVVFDPPHMPDAAGQTCQMHDHYNVGAAGQGRAADVISLFPPFLSEAKRVLRPAGIVLAKIADLVHNHRQQWQQVDFVNAARTAGMTPCDMLIKIDPSAGKLYDPRWRQIKHLRKAHCYWIVVRNSGSCESRDREPRAREGAAS